MCVFEEKLDMNILVLSENYCKERKTEWIELGDQFKTLVEKIRNKREAEKDLLQTKIKQVLN
jgi:hydroxymethylglutaryl-CoA reductase